MFIIIIIFIYIMYTKLTNTENMKSSGRTERLKIEPESLGKNAR